MNIFGINKYKKKPSHLIIENDEIFLTKLKRVIKY